VKIEQAIDALRVFSCHVPHEALNTIRETWPAAEPVLLAEMDWQIQHPLEEDRSALFLYALYLCAEQKSEAAFERYVAMLRLPSVLLDGRLGTILTDEMMDMLSRTCTGRVDTLKVLVEDEALDSFARGTALIALGNLMLDGELSREEVSEYCMQLLTTKLEKVSCHIWDETISFAEGLLLKEALPIIETAYQQGWADPAYQSFESIREQIQNHSEEECLEILRRSRIDFPTVEDAMEFLVSQWPADGVFPEDDVMALLKEPRTVCRSPRKSDKKEPGRNELCPCGSGKKYKKCCIAEGYVLAEDAQKIRAVFANLADEWMAAGYYYAQKKYLGSALRCWRQCWLEVRKLLPAALTDPFDPKCNKFFESCDFFSNWLLDYLTVLEDSAGTSIHFLRDGLLFCREVLEQFPHMTTACRSGVQEVHAGLLIHSGNPEEGIRLLEQMIQRHPETARGYTCLSDMLSWNARKFNLRPDWIRAEQLLRQALVSATDCSSWDIEARLEDLVAIKGNE